MGGLVWRLRVVGNADRNLAFPRNAGVDVLGRGTGLKVCNTFREGLGTHGRDSVSEGDFGDTENALGMVQMGSVILELGEEDADVLVVLLGGSAKG